MSKILELVAFMQEIDAAISRRFCERAYVPDYTIAGGALRDTLLGQPVKDIDVVVSQTLPWNVAWPEQEYGPTGGFQATDGGFSVRSVPVQLIYRNGDTSIDGMIEYYSMAVSSVFWRNGALTFDPQFFKDVADKQHTVNRARWGGMGDAVKEDRLQAYVDKITAKYPWPLRGDIGAPREGT